MIQMHIYIGSIDDKTKSAQEIDDIIESKGEAWSDRLAEVFQDKNNKKKLQKNSKYIDNEGDWSGDFMQLF